MSQYLREPYEHSGGNTEVELDLSNYTTKPNLKRATSIDTFTLESKAALASLRTEVDNLDLSELKDVPVDFCKLSDVVQNGVFKKKLCIINWLPKSMLLILRNQVLVDYSLKNSITQTSKVLERR